MHQLVFTSPLVEVARDTAQTLARVGQCQSRCFERLPFLQMVLRVILVDACEEIVVFRIVGDYLQAVIA